MHLYIYAFTHCLYIYAHIHMYVYTHTCIHKHTHATTHHIRVYMCMYVCASALNLFKYSFIIVLKYFHQLLSLQSTNALLLSKKD